MYFWNLPPLKMTTSAKFPNFWAITRLETLDKQSGSCGLRSLDTKQRKTEEWDFGLSNVKNERRAKKWSFTRVFVFTVLTLVPCSFSLQNIASQYNMTYCWSNREFQTLLSFYSCKSWQSQPYCYKTLIFIIIKFQFYFCKVLDLKPF